MRGLLPSEELQIRLQALRAQPKQEGAAALQSSGALADCQLSFFLWAFPCWPDWVFYELGCLVAPPFRYLWLSLRAAFPCALSSAHMPTCLARAHAHAHATLPSTLHTSQPTPHSPTDRNTHLEQRRARGH